MIEFSESSDESSDSSSDDENDVSYVPPRMFQLSPGRSKPNRYNIRSRNRVTPYSARPSTSSTANLPNFDAGSSTPYIPYPICLGSIANRKPVSTICPCTRMTRKIVKRSRFFTNLLNKTKYKAFFGEKKNCFCFFLVLPFIDLSRFCLSIHQSTNPTP